MSAFEKLPGDCVVAICRFLTPTLTAHLAATTRKLSVVANSASVWTDKLNVYFGLKWEEDWNREVKTLTVPPFALKPAHKWKNIFIRMSYFASEFEPYLGTEQDKYPYRDPRGPATFKIILIGDSWIGKTSLLTRFALDEFQANRVATIGFDFRIKPLQRKGETTPAVKLQVWDSLGGRERFRSIHASVYRGTYGIFICYAIDNKDSFNNVKEWEKEIERYRPEHIEIMLLGLRSDEEKKRQVSYDEGWAYARERGWKFFETSAKTNTNISQAFMAMATLIQRNVVPKYKTPDSTVPSTVANGKAATSAQGFFGWLKSKLGW